MVSRTKHSSSPPRPLVLRRDPERAAEVAGLRYVNAQEPGYSRRRHGRGFGFYDEQRKHVSDADIKARLKALAIPPAWSEVWICADERGHVQATGYDDRGRKQYIYHPDWIEVRDRAKFWALSAFGRALPSIRERVDEDVQREAFDLDKAVAVVIRFMDNTLLRIGNQRYARTNASFGLTTLRKRHLEIEADEVHLQFIGKGGKPIDLAIDNPELAELARQCVEIPGYHLFKYFDEDGERHRVESHHVNEYLQAVSDAPFTAKDFRTWSASVTAAETLWETADEASTQRERKAAIVAMVKSVAELLNNTPAVCRGSYIHPGIIATYEAGSFMRDYERALATAIAQPVEHLDTAEAALLELLPRLKEKSAS